MSGRTDTASMFTKTGQHQTAFGAGDFVIFLWARTVSWLSTSKWLLPKFRKCWAESGVWVAAQWARLRFLRSMRVGPVRASLPKGGNAQLTISKTYMSNYAVKCLGPQVCLSVYELADSMYAFISPSLCLDPTAALRARPSLSLVFQK